MLRQSSEKLVVVLCSLREQKVHLMLCRGFELGRHLYRLLCTDEDKLPAVLGSLREALAKATMRVLVALRSVREAKREKNW